MNGPMVDLVATLVATMCTMLLPGALLVSALRLSRLLPPLLLPAAAVTGSVLVASPLLVATLWLQWSIDALAIALGTATILLAVLALLRWQPDERRSWRRRIRAALPFAPPAAVLVTLGVFDVPQVRSDTYWHVALARKLAELDGLSSARIAFEAGAPGNANYPLPTWHALVALADQMPLVDVWSATWFATLWLGPVAMLAFGGMCSAFVGDRRAGLVGCWTFVSVVVLGYGPWYFATRYLTYPGQVAIYIVLPVVAWAIVHAIGHEQRQRAGAIATAVAGCVAIGLLHGNYALYPSLLAGGGAALLLLGNRARVGAAIATAMIVVATSALALAVQLPWIMRDDNFLRGASDPAGEPTAFARHRDVFVGSASSFHVELGSLATQPWLVVGALALPLLLWLVRRCPGPWVVAGGAVAMVVFARTPQLVDLLDRAGSITPVTRLDRMYPAAIGVAAAMLGLGWLLARLLQRDRTIGAIASAGSLVAIAAGTWWVDSIRDTRRIVVTPFVEARWVGGLDPSGLPRWAVYAATAGIVVVAIAVRLRILDRDLWPSLASPDRSLRHTLATAAIAAVAVGLAPATIERAHATWEPQAYDRRARSDANFVRIEVYPAPVRRIIQRFEPRSTVLASFDETRKVASLVPVYSVEESVLRTIDREPPNAEQARRLLARSWNSTKYVVAARDDESFAAIIEAARACGWNDRSRGGLWIFERRGDRCPASKVDQA